MESTSLNNNSIVSNQIQTAEPTAFAIFGGKILDVFKGLRDLCFKSPTPITSQVVEEKVLTEEEKQKLEKQQKKARQFKLLITEIKTTEKSYQAGLQTLEDLLSSLETSTENEDIKKMLEIAKNLNESSKLFLEKLGKAENSEDLLKAFNKEDMGKIYENFETYLTSALGDPNLFQSKMKTHEFAISIFFNKKVCSLLGCNPQVVKIERALEELQVIPAQRMGRYVLLLREATKLIEEDKTKQATEIFEFVASKTGDVNEAKKKFDHEKEVAEKAFKEVLKFLQRGQKECDYKKMNCLGKLFHKIFKK